MAEVDTSSYPKPVAQPGLLDTVGKFQGLASSVQDYQYKQQAYPQALEQQKIGIDQTKLNLINEHFKIANQELSTISDDPDITPEKLRVKLDNFAKTVKMPPAVYQHMLSEFAGLKTPDEIRNQAKLALTRGMSTQERINKVYGVPTDALNTEQTNQPALQRTGQAPFPVGPPIQRQVPPTAGGIGPGGVPALVGAQAPQLPPGAVAAPGGAPGQFIPQNRLPVAPPPMAAPDASAAPPPVLNKNQDRVGSPPIVPRGPVTGFAPGSAEAMKATGQSSGEALANARKAAENYQQDILPLTESIKALEKLGTKGTGPGTETINNLKSFIISNVPGVKPEEFEGLSNVAAYDKAKKYLVQIARTQGTTGTNDQLAAAFSGNPSVNMSNAAATDVAKSILALRKMKQAQLLIFDKLGLPDDQFSTWASRNQNMLDPRAFGFDQMSTQNRKKLVDGLKGAERSKFEKSLQFAHDAELIEPPGR